MEHSVEAYIMRLPTEKLLELLGDNNYNLFEILFVDELIRRSVPGDIIFGILNNK